METRKTFTRNELTALGLPFNAELIRSWQSAFPDIRIDKEICQFIPSLEELVARHQCDLDRKMEEIRVYDRQIQKEVLRNNIRELTSKCEQAQKQSQQIKKKVDAVNSVLHAVRAFNFNDNALTVESIENLIAKLFALEPIGLQITTRSYQNFRKILEYFAQHKKKIAEKVTSTELYVHQYNFEPRWLLRNLANQVAKVVRVHDETILHHQSLLVRKCIAAFNKHVANVLLSLEQRNGYADDEAVRIYYRKLHAVAQLYHLALRQQGETYLAELIENQILTDHFLDEPEVLQQIQKNDIFGNVFPNPRVANQYTLDDALDVEPIFDFINEVQLVRIEGDAFGKARDELNRELEYANPNLLVVPLVNLFKQDIENEYRHSLRSKSKSFDTKFYTNWLIVTKDLLADPAKHAEKFMAMLSVNTLGKPAISRRRKSLGVAIAGVAIFAGALALGWFSLGVLSPLSVIAMSLGVAMVVSGVSVAMTTGQKGVDEIGQCVLEISRFNHRIQENYQYPPLEVESIYPRRIKSQ